MERDQEGEQCLTCYLLPQQGHEPPFDQSAWGEREGKGWEGKVGRGRGEGRGWWVGAKGEREGWRGIRKGVSWEVE